MKCDDTSRRIVRVVDGRVPSIARFEGGRSRPHPLEAACPPPLLAAVRFSLPILLAAFLPTLANATVFSDVTMVMAGGWEHRHVSVEAAKGGLSVDLIDATGARKRVTTASISYILDARGKDITAQVLASPGDSDAAQIPADSSSSVVQADSASMGLASPANNTPPMTRFTPTPRSGASPRDEVRLYGERWRVMLMCTGGYGGVGGEWFEGLTSGPEFGFSARVMIAQSFFIGGDLRRQNLGVDSQLQSITVYDSYGNPYTLPLDTKVHLTETYFLVGYETEPSTDRSPLAFVHAGLGAVNHAFKVTIPGVGSESSHESKFGLLVGVGGVFPVGSVMGFALEGTLRLTGSGSTSTTEGSSGVIAGVRTGVVVLLGH